MLSKKMTIGIMTMVLSGTMVFPLQAEIKPAAVPALGNPANDLRSLEIYMERQKLVQLYEAGKYDEAMSTAESLTALVENLEDPILQADTLEDIGRIYQTKGLYLEAEKFFQKVLSIREEHLGAFNVGV